MENNNFEGFRPRQKLENYTGVPNEVFDVIMKELNGSEFKLLCSIFRKTYGCKTGVDKDNNDIYKVEDNISQTQLMEMIGSSRNTVRNNLNSLIEKGFIIKVSDHNKDKKIATKYKIKQL